MDIQLNDSGILPIRIFPDSILSQQSKPVSVEEFNTKELVRFVEQMHKTMLSNNGIGLAAVQVGVLKRIITMQIPKIEMIEEKQIDTSIPYTFINPEIVSINNIPFTFNEGCLSVPGYFEERSRPSEIVLKYFTLEGVEVQTRFTDIMAFCIQHEMDHLNGDLFIDNLSRLKKDRVRKVISKTIRKHGK